MKSWRGKDSWKEVNTSFVYEDSDSEAEPASPSKQNVTKILKIIYWWNMMGRCMMGFGPEA